MDPTDLLDGFNADNVLANLHGFQRDAVEHAFQQLYIEPDSTRRFLIADEVGLGKTLIARGVIAKALEHMRHDIDRIDVVYICSNLGIARQNINRLNPLPKLAFSDTARITMMPVTIDTLVGNKINFVSFTPGTSLDLKGNMGMRRERTLLYLMLENYWELHSKSALNVFQGSVSPDRFREGVRRLGNTWQISQRLQDAFVKRIALVEEEKSSAGEPGLRAMFEELCVHFSRKDSRPSGDIRRSRNQLIGALRMLLAEVCINALEPDLIILDEFQRFKYLLDAENEAGQLARQLFEWSDENAAARVLLLSATPYKAYTLQHESDEDNHYEDFVRTIDFLQNRKGGNSPIRELFATYRKQMLQLPVNGPGLLRETRAQIEQTLKKVMSRTERLATASDSNGMLQSQVTRDLGLSIDDLRGFLFLDELSRTVETPGGIEYWKSAAYPLSFMDSYKIKQRVREDLSNPQRGPALANAITRFPGGALPFEAIQAYGPVELANARLRYLADDLRKQHAFEVLWLPPSAPCYRPSGAYAKALEAGISKRLVFSSWHMVPKSIAALLSYISERELFRSDEENPVNDGTARARRAALLRFSRSDGRLTGLPVLTLLYPSRVLAELCDPLEFVREKGHADAPSPEVLAWAEERVRKALAGRVQIAASGEQSDEAWYWAAPIALEREHYGEALTAWWSHEKLAEIWSGAIFSGDAEDTDTNWREHVQHAADFALGQSTLETRAPADLPRVLALAGLGAPGTCALRALLRLYPAAPNQGIAQREAATQIAWGFRTLYNRPESMALVRRANRDEPYWRLCLRHGVMGCLSAVVDEYVHVLRDACGLVSIGPGDACPQIAQSALAALGVRTATLDVDELVADGGSGYPMLNKHSMRSLFAMRFGSDKTEDEKQVQRDSSVRAAFNSPFWPFVLATTSVGQEGLDFHWYCHAIVHWNLPSNPVELEQREGRVHRFKGHAVRKNVASTFPYHALSESFSDYWSAMFEEARNSAIDTGRGLVPYWLFPKEDGAWIERHVPLYPLSKDTARYSGLQRALGAYRMVFGQPRQDELMAYLLDSIGVEALTQYAEIARIDLAPPRFAGETANASQS